MAEAARKLRQEGASSEGSSLPVAGFLGKVGEYPRRIRKYLHDVRAELKLVNWPSWDDVKSTTVVVVVTVAFFAMYFLITDTIFSRMWSYFRHK